MPIPRMTQVMKGPQMPLRKITSLRKSAEDEWIRRGGSAALPGSEVESLCLLHELQVHQIELQMQNDELEHAKNQISEYLSELEAVYRQTAGVVLLVDGERRIRKANARAYTFTGRKLEELSGMRCGEALRCVHAHEGSEGCGFSLFCKDCPIRRAISDAIHRSRSCDQDEISLTISMDENTRDHIFLLFCDALNYHDEALALVSIIDITQKKQTEAENKRLALQLHQSEALAVVGQLAAGIAHNFNNQLTGVIGYANILLSKLEEPGLKRHVENILLGGRRCAELTRQMLAFSRLEEGTPIDIDFHHIVHEIIDMLSHCFPSNIQIGQSLHASRSIICADPGQIQNMILNLAFNARDAMPDGGELILETSIKELDGADCARLPFEVVPGTYLCLCARDTGSGIAPDVLPRIFDPFFTTKEVGQGTGMGLATVYGSIKSNRGAMEVNSYIRKGTTFRLYFPLADSVLCSTGSG